METTQTFDERLIQAAQSSIIKLLASGDWLKIEYGSRLNISTEMLRQVYADLDMETVRARVKEKCEEKLADAIFNGLATEFANDAKKILSNQELREECRSYLRTKMRESLTSLT